MGTTVQTRNEILTTVYMRAEITRYSPYTTLRRPYFAALQVPSTSGSIAAGMPICADDLVYV
ncbi:hypothetical protein BDW22DRAFT_1355063 [Trametopsis cervina]|nr:hypothetical protein BDW22DRAFT_1355063 [Trametopsis cervina]